MVFISSEGNTILELRTTKGIWQNLYQFPLIETDKSLNKNTFQTNKYIIEKLKGLDYAISLYNKTDVVHKLSHQHLYTKFWIIEVEKIKEGGIPISEIKKYPVPILISKFIDAYGF